MEQLLVIVILDIIGMLMVMAMVIQVIILILVLSQVDMFQITEIVMMETLQYTKEAPELDMLVPV